MVKNQELMNLVRRVKYESGLTQNDIAKKIGISKSYLSDTVNGRYLEGEVHGDDVSEKRF